MSIFLIDFKKDNIYLTSTQNFESNDLMVRALDSEDSTGVSGTGAVGSTKVDQAFHSSTKVDQAFHSSTKVDQMSKRNSLELYD